MRSRLWQHPIWPRLSRSGVWGLSRASPVCCGRATPPHRHTTADCFQITLLHLLYLIPSSSPRNRHARTYRSITSESQRSERFTQHSIRQDASGTTRCSKHAPALLYGNAFTARSLNTLQWGPVQRKDVNKRWPRGVKKTEEGDDARNYPCALGLRLPLVLDEAGEVGGRVRVHELYEGIGRA